MRSGLPGGTPERELDGNISACAERSLTAPTGGPVWREHLRVCGAVVAGDGAGHAGGGTSPRVRSGRFNDDIKWLTRRNISACAERSVVFYWDLGWLDGMECLIRALYEVVKWCCSRYLKWMFSIYVTCASRLRMREYCWSPVFGRTLKEDSVD